MFSIDHIGVAVKSLAAAKGIYEKLGLKLSPEEVVEAEQVRVVMVPLGESRPGTAGAHLGEFRHREIHRQAGRGTAPRLTACARPGGRRRSG